MRDTLSIWDAIPKQALDANTVDRGFGLAENVLQFLGDTKTAFMGTVGKGIDTVDGAVDSYGQVQAQQAALEAQRLAQESREKLVRNILMGGMGLAGAGGLFLAGKELGRAAQQQDYEREQEAQQKAQAEAMRLQLGFPVAVNQPSEYSSVI